MGGHADFIQGEEGVILWQDDARERPTRMANFMGPFLDEGGVGTEGGDGQRVGLCGQAVAPS